MAVILVAVANGAIRASISVAAHEGGHQVHAVSDAGELVSAVEQKKPDLLFLDPGLARMDSVEPIKSLHILGLLEGLRLVLVDDRCAELMTWAGLARQMADGVLDAFRKDDVHRAIEALVGPGRMPAAPSPPAASPAAGSRGAARPVLSGARPVGKTDPSLGQPAPAAAPRRDPSRRTILIVEDAPSLRILLGLKFEHEGWRVVWAASGEEALDRVAAEGCDGVLSDINLPGMTGDQLVLTIRKLYPGVALLLMTGLPPERRPKAIPGVPVFGKPLDMDEVLRILDKAVKPRRRLI